MEQADFLALCAPELLILMKMCTLRAIRIRPALRGFVGGRCARGCTSLYHSAIFERAHPDENAERRPQTPCVLLTGYRRSTCLRKSAHSASCADTCGVRRGKKARVQRPKNVTPLHSWVASNTIDRRVLLRGCRDSSSRFSKCVPISPTHLPEYESPLH